MRHRDQTICAGAAQGGTADRAGSDRTDADPHALPMPAAQPAHDLRDGGNAPCDAGVNRRSGWTPAVGGKAVDLTPDIDFIEQCYRYVRLDLGRTTANHVQPAHFVKKSATIKKRACDSVEA